MALIHADPFAHYTAGEIGRVYNTIDITGTVALGAYGIDDRPALRYSGDFSDFVQTQSLGIIASTTGIYEFDIKISSAPPSQNVIVGLYDGTDLQVSLDVTTARHFAIARGFAGTKTTLGTFTAYTFPLDTWLHISWKATVHNSAGTSQLDIYEEGDWTTPAASYTLTGLDTRESANTQWNGFAWGAACDGTTVIMNGIVMDGSGTTLNDQIGPTDVFALWASDRAAATLNQWTLSAGSDVPALLDDPTPDDDTTYLFDSTSGHQQTTFVDAVPYPTRSILGAHLYLGTKKTSGTPTIGPLAVQTATDYTAANQSPGASYGYVMQPYSLMPDGSAFTTAAAFDALEWGAEMTSAGTVRLTQVVVAVLQARVVGGRRNLLTGYTHVVTGDDNLAVGQEHEIAGAMSQAHGKTGTVHGQRSVLFSLDGSPHTVEGNGKFVVYADAIELNGTVALSGVVSAPPSTDNAITRFDGTGGQIQDSALTISDAGAVGFPDGVRQTFNPDATTPGLNVGALAGDPSAPSNGDLWYDSGANELTARINGANVALGAAPGNVDLASEVTGDLPFANLVQASAASLLVGRGSASGAGDFQEIALGTGLSISGTTLNASIGVSGVGLVYPFTDPTISSPTTWVNQGGASRTVSGDRIFLRAPKTNANNLRCLVKTAPSTPYTITLGGFFFVLQGASAQQAGLLFRDSASGKILTFHVGGTSISAATNGLAIFSWTNATTFSATVKDTLYASQLGGVIFLQFSDNGTNRIYRYSVDGVNFIDLYSETRTTFLTADQIGYFANDFDNRMDVGLALLSWTEA